VSNKTENVATAGRIVACDMEVHTSVRFCEHQDSLSYSKSPNNGHSLPTSHRVPSIVTELYPHLP